MSPSSWQARAKRPTSFVEIDGSARNGSKALELAIGYAGEREQFGKQIGVYQAISHSLVDGYVAVELGRSLAYWAAWCVAEGDADTDLAVAAAKSQAPEAAVLACEKSIQVLGGIGFTWEHVLHRYYKRALWLEGALGYGREHRAQAPTADRHQTEQPQEAQRPGITPGGVRGARETGRPTGRRPEPRRGQRQRPRRSSARASTAASADSSSAINSS